MDEQEQLPLKQKPGRKITGPYAISKGKYYFRDYYREHKEYVTCVCGSEVMKSYMCKHIKTKKHLAGPKIADEEKKEVVAEV
jgi:hypothetical protein